MPTGTFVLADIGGYTRFLSDVGIEHAKEITSHLFNRMVEVERVAGRRATSSAMVGRQEVIGPALVVAHRSTPRVTSRA